MAREESFTCPRCGMTSWHPDDVKYGFCGACHAFTGDEPVKTALLPHATGEELIALEAAITNELTQWRIVEANTRGPATHGSATQRVRVLESWLTVIKEARSSLR